MYFEHFLGKCSSTSMYGCYYCKKSISDWDKDICLPSGLQSIDEMVTLGQKARKTLGDNPDHSTKEFTNFQQSNYGQYVRI